jgi:ferredoxin
LQAHVVAQHQRKLPEIRRVDKPTYDQFLVEPIERFDQRNHVFSRTMWDEEIQRRLGGITPKTASEAMRLRALEGSALVAGAIYVDATAGSLVAGYRGYDGHVQDSDGLYSWNDPVNSTQLPVSDPVEMSATIKKAARLYGADLVGICELDKRWVYSRYFDTETGGYGELEVPYKYAIVMGIEMNLEMIEQSPKFEASAATALGYARMSELAPSLAKYIRALGYPAVPCGNDTAQSIPLAIDAGLGELGRNGLLVTPQFGPRQRLCKVFTDLPLQPDRPIDFGLQAFCERCWACAWNCPAEAIRQGERTTQPTSISNRRGILRWPVTVANCFIFWQENGCDCSNCIMTCPWSRAERLWL